MSEGLRHVLCVRVSVFRNLSQRDFLARKKTVCQGLRQGRLRRRGHYVSVAIRAERWVGETRRKNKKKEEKEGVVVKEYTCAR